MCETNVKFLGDKKFVDTFKSVLRHKKIDLNTVVDLIRGVDLKNEKLVLSRNFDFKDGSVNVDFSTGQRVIFRIFGDEVVFNTPEWKVVAEYVRSGDINDLKIKEMIFERETETVKISFLFKSLYMDYRAEDRRILLRSPNFFNNGFKMNIPIYIGLIEKFRGMGVNFKEDDFDNIIYYFCKEVHGRYQYEPDTSELQYSLLRALKNDESVEEQDNAQKMAEEFMVRWNKDSRTETEKYLYGALGTCLDKGNFDDIESITSLEQSRKRYCKHTFCHSGVGEFLVEQEEETFKEISVCNIGMIFQPGTTISYIAEDGLKDLLEAEYEAARMRLFEFI